MKNTQKKPTIITLAESWPFAFASDPDTVYELPALSQLSYEEAKQMQEIGGITDITEQGPKIKKFILDHAKGLENKNISDMEFYTIFNLYALSEGSDKLGESKASPNS